MLPWKVPSETINARPKMTPIRHIHWSSLICSSPRRYVIIAIPRGKEYIITKTIAISKNSIAWYVEAIRQTEVRLEKRMGRIYWRGMSIDFFWKIINGVSRNKPMRHREKSRTNSDDPKSKEVLAAVGTTAKHKEDNITTVIPKRLILSFATLWSKI